MLEGPPDGDEIRDFNKTHPELRDEEMFFGNIDKRAFDSNGSDLREWSALVSMQQKYRTLRVGQRAYDTTGNPLTGLVPLFVQKSEIERLKEAALFE